MIKSKLNFFVEEFYLDVPKISHVKTYRQVVRCYSLLTHSFYNAETKQSQFLEIFFIGYIINKDSFP